MEGAGHGGDVHRLQGGWWLFFLFFPVNQSLSTFPYETSSKKQNRLK
jgi:hypothetical protein